MSYNCTCSKKNYYCSDTVSRVGVFCSLVNAIEMCKTEGVVDIFQVVKALQIQKPGAVTTMVKILYACMIQLAYNIIISNEFYSLQNQYSFIFDLLLTFIESDTD